MRQGLYRDQFSDVFSRLLEKSGISRYGVSKFSGIDQAYLSRLRKGDKDHPSPEVVMRISLALVHWSDKLSLHDIEELFNSTGRTLNIND
jgi:transcriptional regulator with XRE-family HTH domain